MTEEQTPLASEADAQSPAPAPLAEEPAADVATDASAAPARRRWILGASIAAVVIALLLAGAWLTSRDDAPTDGTSLESGATSRSGASGSSGDSKQSARSSPGTMTAAERAAAKRAKKRGGREASRTVALAVTGSRLATVTTPPARTIVMLSPDSIAPDARFAVTFRPYGNAQLGRAGVVVHLDTARPLNKSAEKVDSLSGRNIFASVETTGPLISVGGRYEAELTFATRSNGLSFVLVKPRRIER